MSAQQRRARHRTDLAGMFTPSPGSQEQSAEEVTWGGSLDGIVERRPVGPNESIDGRKLRCRWYYYFLCGFDIVNHVMVLKKSFPL